MQQEKSTRKFKSTNSPVRGRRLLAVAASAAAAWASAGIAHADLNGFSTFAPINTEGASTTDATLGYSGGGTTFKLTSATNGEGTSGWSATAQNISSFALNYSYTTQPQIPQTGGNSIEADGMTLAFQNASTGTTTALGAGGGGFGYTGIGNSSAIANQLFNGYYSYRGGSQLLSNGAVVQSVDNSNVDYSLGHTYNIRISYAGTTISEYVTDTTTGAVDAKVFTGVNLTTNLGPTALVGFTGGTGGYNAGQTITGFQLVSTPTYSPISVTGFNQNMIVPASAPQTGAANNITASMDSGTANPANNAFYEQGYNTAAPTTGLPTSGSTFTSQNDSMHTFKMQSYTSTGDAILLSNGTGDVNTSGTLTFATPAAFKALSLLETSGNGPNYFNVTINYSDGAASSTISSVAAPDWFSKNGQVAYNAQGRVIPSYSGASSFNNVNNNNPVLYQQDLVLPDTADPIASITFTYASGGGNTAIYAVSGAASTATTLHYGGNDPTTPGQFDNGLTVNFNASGASVPFINGDVAIFDDSATGPHTVSVAAAGVNPASVIFNNNSTSYTINGPGSITGTGSVSVAGGGVVTLNNSNTYTGPTSVTSGTLILGSSSVTTGISVSAGSGGTLNVASGATLPANIVLLDNGHVNLLESVTVPTLNGSSGTVSLGGSAITLTLTKTGNFTGTEVGNGGLLNLAGSSGTFSGTITDGSAPSKLAVNSTGTWTIGGTSSFTGGTTLNSGVASVTNNAALGTGPVAMNGGSISSTVPVVLANQFTGSALNVASGSSVIELSNTGNTFTGPVYVNGGTLKVDGQGALGAATTINVSNGASFEPNGSFSSTDVLNITGPGMTSTLGPPLVNGGTGALRGVDNGNTVWAGTVNVSGGAYIVPGVDGYLTVTGNIIGSGGITISGNPGDTAGGTTVLAPTGSNTYTGETVLMPTINTQVTNGTVLQLGANNGISPNSGLNILNSYTPVLESFDMAGYNQSVQYLVGFTPIANVAGLVQVVNSGGTTSTLTVTSGLRAGNPATFGTAITGNINLVMNDPTGLGNQIINGTNTYSGTTTITKGQLTAESSAAFSTGQVTLNGGTLGLGALQTPATPLLTSSNFSNFTFNTSNAAVGPSVSGGVLHLTTSGTGSVADSAFNPTPVTVSDTAGFTAKFTYNSQNGYADGAAFVLQNDPRGAGALGGNGGSFGFAGTGAIVNSGAVYLNIYYFSPQGGLGTGFVTNGNLSTGAQIGTVGVNGALAYSNGGYFYGNSQNIDVTLTYDGLDKTLTESLYGEGSGNTFQTIYTGIDFSSIVGGAANGSTTAYVGFTGGVGGIESDQYISNFSYALNSTTAQSVTNPIVAAANTSSGIQIAVDSASTSNVGVVGSLNIASGATVKITTSTGAKGVFEPASLTIASTGTLDLVKNSMDLNSSSGATLAGVTALVKTGFNGGAWNGPGIASSAAAADPQHLTALGVILNDNGSSTPLYGTGGSLYPTFDGAPAADNDILVKYTYYGDANLDGAVDGSDYTLIDNGFNNHLTGWYNGDFNYDGVIDGSDYTLIDNAFNTQGGSLGSNPAALVATSTSQISGGSAVPEPTTLGLLGVGAIGLLGRRRRSK